MNERIIRSKDQDTIFTWHPRELLTLPAKKKKIIESASRWWELGSAQFLNKKTMLYIDHAIEINPGSFEREAFLIIVYISNCTLALINKPVLLHQSLVIFQLQKYYFIFIVFSRF